MPRAAKQVVICDVQSSGDGSYAVVDANVGVPQRIPQPIGDPLQHLFGLAVVQQQQVQVGVGRQFAAAQPTDPDDREATGIGDADLGSLGDQPGFVQLQP